MRPSPLSVLASIALCATLAHAAPPSKSAGSAKPEKRASAATFSGLAFRSIGPALTSGRVTDLAVHPTDPSTWYVVAAYGGVWKTTNAGTTWQPIFDAQNTSSIGCVTIDARDPLTVWVGTGENNSQRSVGWGDGVYVSHDGGKSWTHSGLKTSEHIGQIRVHPDDSKTVFVASQGPLWAPGGERGLYKTTDGGTTWKRVLHVDDWTGASEVYFDPRDARTMYAVTYQRHRKVWTLIDGGPGSGLWKSRDGGETWTKLSNGLPSADMGRIGLAVSTIEPGTLYAIVEAANEAGGVYASSDGGANWEKRSSYLSSSPQYYQELFCDPKQPGRVYSMDTFLMVTDDGGRNWRRLGERSKHVDNHVIWIDPADTRHYVVGCDGGLYQSFDRGATWNYFANLPITQFYKLEVDNAEPFYNVYGGTQDNNTQGGPSRTANESGIRNSDWFILLGGDGFQPRVDPVDPNIAYAQYQHGGLVRFDRKTGEQVDIQPQPEPGEDGSRWNWDSPLIISPHAHQRLYFGSQRLYRSDDRGQAWRAVSPDLTRRIDRNRLPVMGRVWSVDAVAKNASTSIYGNLVALDESPLAEGLLAIGTDDGLVQISEDGGTNWRKLAAFPGIGEYAYVSRVLFSRHARNTLYVTFDRHKMGDFKPYVLKSTDLGKSWASVAGDLPANATVYALVEDHVDANLLFCGTEFGVFVTQTGGREWVRLKGGLPIACIRDLAIQRRENDLVVATFSRGFYVLDDYSPLRSLHESGLAAEAALLPPRKALLYVPASPLGGRGRAEQGESFYVADNPPFGATFTYWLREDTKTRKDARRESEAAIAKKGGHVYYPSWDSLRAESREEAPTALLTISTPDGQVVRRITGPVGSGIHRVSWDLRWPTPEPVALGGRERGPFQSPAIGPLVAPGTYRVALSRRVDGVETALASPQTFTVEPLMQGSVPAPDRAAVLAFQARTARLQRAVLGATRVMGEAQGRVAHLKLAIDEAPGSDAALAGEIRALERRLADLAIVFNGDDVIRAKNEATPPSLTERVATAVEGGWSHTSPQTTTHQRNVEIASADFAKALETLRGIVRDLEAIESRAEVAGAPWTPGRMPDWKPE